MLSPRTRLTLRLADIMTEQLSITVKVPDGRIALIALELIEAEYRVSADLTRQLWRMRTEIELCPEVFSFADNPRWQALMTSFANASLRPVESTGYSDCAVWAVYRDLRQVETMTQCQTSNSIQSFWDYLDGL